MSGFREKIPTVETERISESEQAVRLLESLIDSTAFETQVISVHARKYQDKLTDVQRAIQSAVKEQLKGRKALEEEVAFTMINEAEPGRFADVKEAQQTLQAKWPIAIRGAKERLLELNPTVQVNGEDLPYTESEAHARKAAEAQFLTEKITAQKVMEEQRATIIEAFDALKEELELRKADPEFIAALDVWGRSPNAAGERGEDGTGFHAGIIHFFEYRAYRDKAGRFYGREGTYKAKHDLSIQAFIDFSRELATCTTQPRPDLNPEVQKATLVGDEEGRLRLMVFTKHGLFLNAFKKVGDRMRVITAIPQDEKNFDKRVESEVYPKAARNRLNTLSDQRKTLPLESYSG